MAHGHSHRAGTVGPEVEVDWVPRVSLLGILAGIGVATLIGLLLLWPDRAAADDLQGSVGFAADGVTFPKAVVEEVEPACESAEVSPAEEQCGRVRATVDEGPDAGVEVLVEVPPQVTGSGLDPGDRLELVRQPPEGDADARFAYFGTDRSGTLWLLGIAFVVVVVAIARLRGVMALLGLGFASAVMFVFALPALLTGESAIPVALVAATVIMYVVLYTTHGFSVRTSTALAGTLAGLAITAFVGWWAVRSTHLAGVAGEEGGLLAAFTPEVSFQGLLIAAVIIAGLGVLNDVTITQSSAVWELRAASPTMTRTQIFHSGMRIGRDHIASTIYTIVFAYAGTALTLLLVLQLYDRPVVDLLGTEEITAEIVRSLVSSIGLVLAVPLTTAIAALTVPAAAPTGGA
ncbi:YibE/F family protein [Nocardioides sp. cx-173]|uniref:YibE/F family protein n=1 Tax=Nocardioides sp. cx-173 TaxID=2898796 RepID=UPI001E3BA23A|nr:YibE/F family protein [Nocardioides sp. cx-173]MCD4523528.1 YibE/F family protein [Nocardioides sp. cx-173]UGB42134.1 YibE/F family protein [Nocardioides sp. cx-173]